MKRDIEHQTQRACVNWFRYVYDDALIFAVPNGGRRDKETGSRLKAEGVLAGVADIIILSSVGTIFIEMKTIKAMTTAFLSSLVKVILSTSCSKNLLL